MQALLYSVPPTLQLATANPRLCQPVPPPETPRHSRASLGQSLWGHCSFLLGPGVHKVCLRPLSFSGGMQFDSKCDFAPLPFFLGFTFALGGGISSQSRPSTTQPPLQSLPSCCGFSALGRGVSPCSHFSGGGSSDSSILMAINL